ncbi:MAG TPA: VWA domain-containing protein [Herpetosiphonaceae bacterium]|nr:VWA domain-containing protein [Herpetosiphonaceae bacterium]
MEWHRPIVTRVRRLLGAVPALVVVLGFLASSVAGAESARLDIIEINTTSYPTVKVTFSASGADGLPVTELDKRAIKVAENGQEQALVSAYALRNSTIPLSIMLAFDTSGGMKDEGKLDQAKVAAKAFISQMRPIDKLGLVQFDSAFSVIAPFSSDRAALTKKIDGLTAQGNTRLYDALYLAVNEVVGVEGSKAVVLLTDGQDTESVADLSQVLALVREKGIKVYAIGVGSDIDERVLGQIARTSGGYFYKAPAASDIASAFKLMSDQLRNRYEIAYSSPAMMAQGTKIEVKVVADTPGGPVTGLASYLMPAYIPKTRPADALGGQLQSVSAPVTAAPISKAMIYASSALAAFGVLLICGGMGLSRSLRAHQQRLRHFVSTGDASGESEDGDSLFGALAVGVLRILAGVSTRFLPPSHIRRLSHNLVLAGNPFGWRVSHFITVKTVLAIAFSFLAMLLFFRPGDFLRGILLIVAMGLLGFYLPNVWLGARIKARQKEILKSLPDALDLLSISVEAGLGLDGAILEVVNKWDNTLADEFSMVLAELKMGRSRKEALRGLAYRTGVQEVATFTAALVQADELGMGIARTLALQAQQMRMKRRQRAEKLAHEATIKMLFPMIFFILPAIFIVILGPVISQFAGIFGK